MRRSLVACLTLLPLAASYSPSTNPTAPKPRSRSALLSRAATARTALVMSGTADGVVVSSPPLDGDALLALRPNPELSTRELIDAMMAAVHRDNLGDRESARPYLGAEVALRFLSSTHQAASLQKDGGPPAFERYLRQPHKAPLISWSEFRLPGPAIVVERAAHPDEAFQQVEVRASSDGEWSTVRWLLLRGDDGAWRVDGLYSEEPDEDDGASIWAQLEGVAEAAPDPSACQKLFAEFDVDGSGALCEEEIRAIVSRLGIRIADDALHALIDEIDTDKSGEIEYGEFEALLGKANAGCAVTGDFAAAVARSATTESPREVVQKVMQGMRRPDEPYASAGEAAPAGGSTGAAVAVRYCSPTNGASSLSPEAFAAYLQEPWYQILTQWEEMEIDDDDDIDASGNTAEVEVLVRRDPADSFSVVSFQMSRHDARWLVDGLGITE